MNKLKEYLRNLGLGFLVIIGVILFVAGIAILVAKFTKIALVIIFSVLIGTLSYVIGWLIRN